MIINQTKQKKFDELKQNINKENNNNNNNNKIEDIEIEDNNTIGKLEIKFALSII